jgi:hypothetical protein
MPVVLGYTALHLAGFVLFGLAVAGLFALAEREKRVLVLIFMLGCCLAVVFVAVVYGRGPSPGVPAAVIATR